VKFINSNSYDVTVRWGDSPDKIPNYSVSVGANKKEERNISLGKHVFAVKYPNQTKEHT